MYLLCLCARLFVCALWSPAGKGLASWLSFVVFSCEFVTFPLVSTPYLCNLTYSVAAEVFQVGSHIYP